MCRRKYEVPCTMTITYRLITPMAVPTRFMVVAPPQSATPGTKMSPAPKATHSSKINDTTCTAVMTSPVPASQVCIAFSHAGRSTSRRARVDSNTPQIIDPASRNSATMPVERERYHHR